ncbi:MAG: DNA polymerase I [uncultured Solirubrobacterales bacterium]|uniref:DNA polymerase I n=1 Tax=uncultured Solirubrobacterales bacterium TaxID=768556 RepID=A0A6J4SQR6_9ACTN|nr:MAG: DNA polymerase I [uncultured Solirubrobacterales bacterium]
MPAAPAVVSPSTRTELFLIDGNSLAYRAFFALPETIATSRGFPTNAIFGFASMLVKILDEHGQRPTLVVWDAGMSGRKEVYADYKAQRSSKPDLLREQWPHLAPLVEAFGYRNIKVEGYEADDVIATLARRAREEGIDVTIVTGDRDALQLVEPGVSVMATSRGITDTKTYERETVIERYGIPPELIPDFYGLKGDTSDNIPGVPGIGDKTAAQLLQRFGDLETVLASVDEISGAKRKQNLVDHAEDARVSKRLATANREVDFEIDLEETAAAEPDRSLLRSVFREFELRDPLRRLEEALGEGEKAAPAERAEVEVHARAVEVPVAELAGLEGELATLVAERVAAPGEEIAAEAAAAGVGGTADESEAIEPFGDPDQVAPDEADALEYQVAGALSSEELADEALVAEPLDSPAPPPAPAPAPAHLPLRFAAYAGRDEVLVGEAEAVAALELAWGDRPVVAHDWKAIATLDPPLAPEPGAPPAGSVLALAHDTMVAAYLLDPARRAFPLEELTAEQGIGAHVQGGDALAERAIGARALAERQRTELSERGLERLFAEVELPLVEVLVAMEGTGVALDVTRLAEIGTRFEEQISALEREVHELAGEEFTIGSPQQLAEVLFVKLGLSRKRRGKTGFSTDARVLQAIRDEHPIIRKVEEWRELTKLKNTYLDALPELVDPRDGRLHTTFNQTIAATGRLSSTNPNLQNIPVRSDTGREIRACFVAAPGTQLLSADYSQVELRVLAHIAGDDVLKSIFARGEDIHTATTAEMFDIPLDRVDKRQRDRAKMINYGIVYGLSAYGLADRLQIPQDEAQEFIDRYLGRFPGVRDFIRDTIARALNDGYVTTLFGRARRIPELRARQRQTQLLGERLAVNTVIQGTAADIIKVAMVRCHRALREAGLATRLVLQIHDELLFEAPVEEIPAASEIVRREMTDAYVLDPPLAVDLGAGPNWLDAK